MIFYIGADHRGFESKVKLKAYLEQEGFEVKDVGDDRMEPDDDFPQFAGRCAMAVLGSDDKDPRGILICGSGQGMCMAANRFKGIRAVLAHDKESARSSRCEDDSNVICLANETVQSGSWQEIINTWVDTPFAAAPRYVRRIKELDDLG